MKVFLFPGLGFDHRIFQKLDLQGNELNFLDWIEPFNEETFSAYAMRMATQFEGAGEKIALIGHSMGGMAVQEIAAQRSIDKIVLISSIRSRQELPFQFKIFNPLNIHKLFSSKLATSTVKYWGKRHDYITEEEQELFKSMVSKQSNSYLRWALKSLSIWQTPNVPDTTQILQLHGEEDRTFPLSYIQNPDVVLPKAGHFMVYRHADTLSQLINMFLEQ